MTGKRRLLALASLAVMVVAAVGATSQASTFLREDIPSLTRGSESVIQARVLEMRSEWNAEHTYIFTHVTLKVLRSFSGNDSGTVVVRVPGGTVDGYTVQMHGAPEFKLNQNVVVFLDRWDDGVPMVNGYFQGVARVEPDLAGNPVLRGGVADGLPLAELERTVRDLALEGGK